MVRCALHRKQCNEHSDWSTKTHSASLTRSPNALKCDKGYNNGQFKAFCGETSTIWIAVVANDHEANARTENPSRTWCSFYDRFRSCREKAYEKLSSSKQRTVKIFFLDRKMFLHSSFFTPDFCYLSRDLTDASHLQCPLHDMLKPSLFAAWRRCSEHPYTSSKKLKSAMRLLFEETGLAGSVLPALRKSRHITTRYYITGVSRLQVPIERDALMKISLTI